MAFKSPRTNQIFSRSNKNSVAMAAQSEATFTNNLNPQPELSASVEPRMDLAAKLKKGHQNINTMWGDQGIRRVGRLRILIEVFHTKKNE